MDLHAHICHADADIGAIGLGDGREESRTGGLIGIAGRAFHVDGGGAGQTDGAGGKDLGPRGGQHPAHIGVLDDRAHLVAVMGIGHGLLKRRLGHADTLHPHAQTRAVHHGEHRGHALVFLAHQPAGGALVGHHAGRAAMDAQLVLQADDLEAVGHARLALIVGQEFRHHEQADAARALGRTGQPRQHQMTDVRTHVAVAPGDVDLLPADPVGPVARRLGPRRQGTDIAACAGFGQVHGARPFAADELGQIQRLHRVIGMMLQRLDLALRQQGVQLQRQAGARHHLGHGHVQRLRQAHPAPFRIGRDTDPAALGDGAEPFGIARRGPQHAVLQPRGRLVAAPVQRRKDVGTQLARLVENRAGRLGRRLGKALGRRDIAEWHDMVQDKVDLRHRRLEAHLVPLRLGIPARRDYHRNHRPYWAAKPHGSTETPRHECRPCA